jgi:hypothetical protein
MAGNTVDLPPQIQAGAPGTAMLGSNTKVKGQPGFLATMQDSLTFANGATGVWLVPNTKTQISKVFMISATCAGTAQPPGPVPPVPVVVVSGDAKIRSL